MRRVWRRHPWLVAGFALATLLAVVFGTTAMRHALGWRDAAPGPVAAWMTPRFLVHAYGIPPDVLADLLGLDPGESPRVTLTEIARSQGMPVDDLIDAIEAELVRARGLP